MLKKILKDIEHSVGSEEVVGFAGVILSRNTVLRKVLPTRLVQREGVASVAQQKLIEEKVEELAELLGQIYN